MNNLVSQIIGGIFGGGIVTFLIAIIYKRLTKQVDMNTENIKEVKENYIDRFEKVNDGISKIQIAVARIETKIKK